MKKLLSIIIVLIITSSGAFYGGMKYTQSRSFFSNFSRQNFQNLSEEQRQNLFQENTEKAFEKKIKESNTEFLNGEVIAKDEQSIALEILDSSSKIIFFSASTQISKIIESSVEDIEIGKQVMVTGEENSNGSYTAQTIQLLPHLISH